MSDRLSDSHHGDDLDQIRSSIDYAFLNHDPDTPAMDLSYGSIPEATCLLP
jgi:hypothetical protein